MTPADYLDRLGNLNTLAKGLQNLARSLHDIAQHIEDRPLETCFGNLEEIGNDRLFAGCKSFNAEEFPTPESIQNHLDLWKSAYEKTRVAWFELDSNQRRSLPSLPDWHLPLNRQLR